jgi:DNA-binding response OmpR family regulator
LKILIVDDDAATTQMLADYLGKKGDACTVHHDGKAGLEAMKDRSFDIVFLDLNMPGFSGFDTLRALAYGGLLEGKHVFVITAMDVTPRQEKQMINAGVVGLIRKPFSLAAIDKAVDRYRGKTG